MTGHDPTLGVGRTHGERIDDNRRAPAGHVQGRLAKAVGAAAERSIALGADVAQEVDEVCAIDAIRDPVGPGRAAEPGCIEIADLQNARRFGLQKPKQVVARFCDERQVSKHARTQELDLLRRKRPKADQDRRTDSQLGGITAVLNRFPKDELQPFQGGSSQQPTEAAIADVAGGRIGLGIEPPRRHFRHASTRSSVSFMSASVKANGPAWARSTSYFNAPMPAGLPAGPKVSATMRGKPGCTAKPSIASQLKDRLFQAPAVGSGHPIPLRRSRNTLDDPVRASISSTSRATVTAPLEVRSRTTRQSSSEPPIGMSSWSIDEIVTVPERRRLDLTSMACTPPRKSWRSLSGPNHTSGARACRFASRSRTRSSATSPCTCSMPMLSSSAWPNRARRSRTASVSAVDGDSPSSIRERTARTRSANARSSDASLQLTIR